MTVWTHVDGHVFRWVAEDLISGSFSSQVTLNIRPDEPFVAVPGLTAWQVDEALQRLIDGGIVAAAHPRHDATGYVVYWGLRVTARGHRLFGDWPDLEQVSALDALRLALEVIADGAPPEERGVLRRGVGILGEIGLALVQRRAAAMAGEIGGEL
jgi:hypothetical protein